MNQDDYLKHLEFEHKKLLEYSAALSTNSWNFPNYNQVIIFVGTLVTILLSVIGFKSYLWIKKMPAKNKIYNKPVSSLNPYQSTTKEKTIKTNKFLNWFAWKKSPNSYSIAPVIKLQEVLEDVDLREQFKLMPVLTKRLSSQTNQQTANESKKSALEPKVSVNFPSTENTFPLIKSKSTFFEPVIVKPSATDPGRLLLASINEINVTPLNYAEPTRIRPERVLTETESDFNSEFRFGI